MLVWRGLARSACGSRALSSAAGALDPTQALDHMMKPDEDEAELDPPPSSSPARAMPQSDVPERLYRRASNVVSIRFVNPFCNSIDVRRAISAEFPGQVLSLLESRTPHYNRTGRWFVELDSEATARDVVKAFHGRSLFGQRLHAWTVSPINLQSTTSRSVAVTENALVLWDAGVIDYKDILRFFRGFKLKDRYPVSALTPEKSAYKVAFHSQAEMFRALRERNHRPLSGINPASPIVKLRVL